MAIGVAVMCVSSSVIAGIVLMMNGKGEDIIEAPKKDGIHIWVECNYKGEDGSSIVPEKGEEGELSMDEIIFKSITVSEGIEVDLYTLPDKKGTKKTVIGPHEDKCTTFQSMAWTRK